MKSLQCDPNIELNGHTTLALTENIMHGNIDHILAKYGLQHIEPEGWYPLQLVLDVLKEISHEDNISSNYVAIGMKAAETTIMPPSTQDMSIEEFFFAYEKIYPTRYRNGVVGSFTVEKVAERHLKLILDIPYPDDVFYGLMYGFTRRFLPKGSSFTLKYDELLPRQDAGGDVTVMHLTWEN